MGSGPPHIRNEDVIIHGEFVQFHGNARCDACQIRNLKCALQESDDGCMSCAGAGRDCVFTRTVTVTGPKSIFSWGSLTVKEQGSVRLNANLEVTGAVAGAKPEPIIITPAQTLQPPLLYTPEPSSARLSTAELPSPALRRFDELPSRPEPRPGLTPSDSQLLDPTQPGDANLTGGSLRRERSISASERSPSRKGLDPLRRDALDDEHVLSIADQERRAEIVAKNALIEQWLEREPPKFDEPPRESEAIPQRFRSEGSVVEVRAETSTGTNRPASRRSFGNGPSAGSDGSAGEPAPDSPPASVHLQQFDREAGSASPTAAFALIDAHPWIEPLRFPSMPGTISQPATSNAAMVRFARCAETLDTISRAASEGEHGGFLGEQEIDLLSRHPGILSRLSLGPPSMAPPLMDLQMPQSAPPGNRILRPKPMELSQEPSPTLERSKTMPISSSGSPIADSPRRTSANRPANYTSRWATVNASPKATKANRTRSIGHRVSRTATELSDDMDDSFPVGEGWAAGELSAEYLQPTQESFQKRIRDREPRIEDFLLERLTKEQLNRYKALVDLKVEHKHSAQAGNCINGVCCTESPQFQRAQGIGTTPDAPQPEKEEEGSEAGYAIEAALFPPGVPLPPVKRLPAEFECPFCFTVRAFQKPSDWSKHIQEDVAPFICTFPNCPEPKSFKRKADWVRHENERHRQLEWWQCNKEGCMHVCFRRDNFVQHLVREHKMAEPKPKASGSTSTRGPERATSSKHSAEEQVIKMVDACRRETTKNSAEEPCRFCGNRCNSFKKLTVHLARHMETISLPILDLVSRYDADSGTIDTEEKAASVKQEAPPQPPRLESPINVIVPANRGTNPVENKEPSAPESPAPPPALAPVPPTAEKPPVKEKAYRCEVTGCTHDRSFASQNDLNRHMKGVHGIYQGGSDPRFFRCQGQDCSKEGKIWPRLDNFRGHIARMHPDEDVDELIRKSGFTNTDGITAVNEQEARPEPESERMEVDEAPKQPDNGISA